jgi:hypothetical protein
MRRREPGARITGGGRRSGRKSVIRPRRDTERDSAIVRHAPRDSLRGTVCAVGSTMDGGERLEHFGVPVAGGRRRGPATATLSV